MKLLIYLLTLVFFLTDLAAQQVNLNYFTDQALANSPLLKDYQNQIRSNGIDSLRVRAGFGPMVRAESYNVYAPVINGWGYDEAITNGANISVLLSVSKEIPGRHFRENQYRAIQVQDISLKYAQKISEQELVRSVTDQYISTYGLWQQVVYYQEVLDLLKKEEPALRNLTENNVYNQTDYLSFLVTLKQQEFQMAQTKSLHRYNLAMLNYLCGIEDTTFSSLTEPELTVSTPPEVENSVFYQQFIADSLKLLVDNKQIDLSYRPKVNLFGDGGYTSSWAYQPWKNFGASAGISLSIPVYDGRQRKMQHDKNRIAEQTRQNYRLFYVNQYHQQINRYLQQLTDNRHLGENLDQQLVYSRALTEANHKLLQTGDVRIADYILAIQAYLNIKNLVIQNTIEKYLIINRINYLSSTK